MNRLAFILLAFVSCLSAQDKHAPMHRLTWEEYAGTLAHWRKTFPKAAVLESRGMSGQNMPVSLLKITDPTVKSTDKQVCLVTTLHRGPERTGTTGAMAFAEWCLSNDPLAVETRKKQIVLTMPCVNPLAMFYTDRFEADAQRTFWGPELAPLSKKLWHGMTMFYSAHYGYAKYDTMVITQEVAWEQSLVARMKGLMKFGNGAWLDEKKPDAIARESIRVLFTVTKAPQPSLDPKQLVEWIPNSEYGGHAFGCVGKTRNETFAPFLANHGNHLVDLRKWSPISHASADDPPATLITTKEDKPPVKGEPQADPTHSAVLGLMLQDTLALLSAPCEVQHPFDGKPMTTR